MFNWFNIKLKKILQKQNKYSLIFLCIFPLILLNLGWFTLTSIKYRWEKSEQKEQAKQEVEELAATSEFSYSMGTLAGDFLEDLKARVMSYSILNNDGVLQKYIKQQSEYIFRPPFPEYELFVFKIDNSNKKTKIIYTNVEKLSGKRALELSFEYLCKVNIQGKNYVENNTKTSSDITKSILGGETDPSIIAESQKGKTFFSLYKQKSNYFHWDYFINEKDKNIFGFFIITRNDSNSVINSKLLALRNFRNNHSKKQIYGAFIPLFAGYGGIVVDEEFAKMPDYKKMVRKWIPNSSDELYNWYINKFPNNENDTKFGNYEAYFHIASGQSHAAVLITPIYKMEKMPEWLPVINLISFLTILSLIIRGVFFGKWPQFSLKTRFFITYFLAACIPLGLLTIAFYGYISAYEHSVLFDYLSQLRLAIRQFDTRKTQKQEEYKTLFYKIKNDPLFNQYLIKYDEVNEKTLDTVIPQAEKVLDRSLDLINHEYKKLPIISLTIIDERGSYFSNLGNNKCQYFKNYKEDEISKKYTFKNDELINKSFNENTLGALLFSLIQPVRKEILNLAPDTKKWDENDDIILSPIQKLTIDGFKTVQRTNSFNLSDELDKRHGMVSTRLIGDNINGYIHDYIYIDGVPRYILFIAWDTSSLDDVSFKSSLDYFSINKPNFIFSAYSTTSQGIKPWIDSGRHEEVSERIKIDLARNAYFRKSYVSKRYKDVSIVAVPSKKYQNKIIIGTISHHYLKMPIFIRVVVAIAIIILSLIIFLFCIYYSNKIFIKPIGILKETLDRVAEGDLDIELKSGSNDEFGTMCQEFSNMTIELSERNKLSTLISDHAVEALSRKEKTNNESDVESFIGTALVTDIRNFTGMCEKYSPELITDLLNKHFAIMTKIITENGGRIYKYIGDAIEVIFANRDDSEKTSVERAFNASIEMIEALKQINKSRLENNLFEYKIGIGLSYGKMQSGSIGSLETRLDYAIIGNAIDNAIKLESQSKLNPEIPIVFSKNFVVAFNSIFTEINFKQLSDIGESESYIIDNNSIDSYFNSIDKNLISGELVNINENTNTTKDKPSNTSKIIKINEGFSLAFNYITGFGFLLLFFSILIFGLYFTYSSSFSNKLTLLENDNQRALECFVMIMVKLLLIFTVEILQNI